MPVKFGPEGYTGPGIRRYQAHKPPDGSVENARGAASRNRRTHIFGLVLTITVIVAMLAYLGRPANSTSEYIAVGKVLAKESIAAPDGGTKRVLGLSFRTATGAQQNAVLECSDETWRLFAVGDEIIAHYTTDANGEIVVTKIGPKPAAVEL
jgi:hypothetical protein